VLESVLQTKGLVKNVPVFGRFFGVQSRAESSKIVQEPANKRQKATGKAGFSDPVFENLVKSAPACQAVTVDRWKAVGSRQEEVAAKKTKAKKQGA
jgi:hypothetical protein